MAIPYVAKPSTTHFRVPRTLAADFDAFLEHDIPNTVMDFEVVQDWYDKYKDGYEPRYVRGEIYPDATKSRYENTDNNMNIRCSLTSGIRKGDMVVNPDGVIYLLDWGVIKESNNAMSRALRCNLLLNVKRSYTDEDLYNENGYRMERQESPYLEIAAPIPCNAYRYDGRPEYSAISGTPGVTPSALTLLSVQYNDSTKNIRIDDIFDWADETYRIIDIDRVGVGINADWGVLKLQAKKAEGGLHGY